MGKRPPSTSPNTARKRVGHVSTGPTPVRDQSTARIRALISPSALKMSWTDALFMDPEGALKGSDW